MLAAPGHAHLHAIEILYQDNFWLRDSLYRDTAPVPIYQISAPGVILSHLVNMYRDRARTQ